MLPPVKKYPQKLSVLLLASAWWAGFPVSSRAEPAPLDIPQTPLLSGVSGGGGGTASVAPNLLYIHDDSGSMLFSFVPDKNVIDNYDEWQYKNSAYNKLYYNPKENYEPPYGYVKGKFQQLGNATFTKAWFNGYDLAGRDSNGTYYGNEIVGWMNDHGTTVSNYANTATRQTDLSRNFIATGDDKYLYWAGTNKFSNSATGSAAHYYYGESRKKITVGSPDDLALTGKNAADSKTNFANWYSYYRTRNYVARAGISRAFANLPPETRLGWGRINKGIEDLLPLPPGSDITLGCSDKSKNPIGENKKCHVIEHGVAPFDEARKKAFYDWLLKTPAIGSTPLKNALYRAGEYYKTSEPWANNPGGQDDGKPRVACRKSFTILMTDGLYEQDGRDFPGGDADSTASSAIPRPAGSTEPEFAYAGARMNPFKDPADPMDAYNAKGITLADIAMYYWKTDLDPTLENRVPESTRDPAYWQHMTTFTIGFGVKPAVADKDAAFAAADKGEAYTGWPKNPDKIRKCNNNAPTAECRQIDDLLHAAVNGHGDSFMAQKPQEFVDALTSVLTTVKESAVVPVPPGKIVGAVTANSASLQTETRLYEAAYSGKDESTGETKWTGALTAYSLCTSAEVMKNENECSVAGAKKTPAAWSASFGMAATRQLLTWIGTAGKAHPEAAFPTAAQKTALGGDAVITQIREQSLGDIINSAPLFADPGKTNFGWSAATSLSDAERLAYRQRLNAARQTGATPKGTVFVGANDGMLHAFSDADGRERFAYIPHAATEHLAERFRSTDHRYLVDGSPMAADMMLDGDWHTVVIGSTGAGGRAYFALDVENPDAPRVLWEISGGGDTIAKFPATAGFQNLGVTIGKASLVKSNDPDHPWVAIFGNGYNSGSNNGSPEPYRARLFIVDAQTGALVREISTGVGDATNGNGLATPLAVDYDGDSAADAAYAGDLQGNLWRFDLSGKAADWKVSFAGKPLFQAKNAAGAPQPITAQPAAMRRQGHPGEAMVYVGSGRFFAESDMENKDVQTFYGIADPCGAKVCADDALAAPRTRANLAGLTLATGNKVGATETRTLTPIEQEKSRSAGFYVDLAAGGQAAGERIVDSALVYSDRIYFTGLVPVRDESSGSSASSGSSGGGDPCNPQVQTVSIGSTQGWLYAIDPWRGTQLDFALGEDFKGAGGIKASYHGAPIGMYSPTGLILLGEEPIKATLSQQTGRRLWRQLR